MVEMWAYWHYDLLAKLTKIDLNQKSDLVKRCETLDYVLKMNQHA